MIGRGFGGCSWEDPHLHGRLDQLLGNDGMLMCEDRICIREPSVGGLVVC